MLLLGFAAAAAALEPPPRTGTSRGGGASLPDIDPSLGIGNTSVSPDLVRNLSAALSPGRGSRALPPARAGGLPSTGSPRILVLLVDFDDYPARPADTPAAIKDRVFASGGTFPYESLSAYYARSSFGKLKIQGDVLGWYRAGKRADVPQTLAGREALIKKALLSFDVDFSRYDNNNDGVIDYFAVIWTGPPGPWATFWWGCAPTFYDQSFTVGGKTLRAYSWQWLAYKWEDPADGFKANTLIHETGHAMGLPDYYDYKPGDGPDGGLGDFDMMDSAQYDHNCFSKMLLGWLEPRRINFISQIKMRRAEDSGDCAMLMPAGRAAGQFGEFFLVENRRRAGNDSKAPFLGGLVVWHVDATLGSGGKNFLYNNQTASHKLLKFVEADGREELEKGTRKSLDAFDFFSAGTWLGPDTTPSSRLYDGTESGFLLRSAGGDDVASFSMSPARSVAKPAAAR